jgi:hypothetical protein
MPLQTHNKEFWKYGSKAGMAGNGSSQVQKEDEKS